MKNYLLLLLDLVESDGGDLESMRTSLGLNSKQALNNHLTKYRRLGLLHRVQSYPFAIYELTPLGKRVKENIGQPDSLFKLWRIHNKIIGFQIFDFGSWTWNPKKTKQMKGWFYQKEWIRDSYGEWSVDIQSNGTMKVTCPEMYEEKPQTAFGRMTEIASRIAETYKESFGMRIGLSYSIRDGHKELVGSEKLGKLIEKQKVGNVWVDNSTGSDRLEESEKENGLEELLEVPKVVKMLTEHMIRQTEIMDGFTKQFELHYSVLNDTKNALRDITIAVTELKDAVREMRK